MSPSNLHTYVSHFPSVLFLHWPKELLWDKWHRVHTGRTPFLLPTNSVKAWKETQILITLTHTRLMALCPGLPGWAGTRKVKPIWILLKQETVSGSGISWATCKSAPRCRQITTPAPHHSVFCRPDALPAAQPTASKHWRLDNGTRQCNQINSHAALPTINFSVGMDFNTGVSSATKNLVLVHQTPHELQCTLQHVMHRLTRQRNTKLLPSTANCKGSSDWRQYNITLL